MRSSSANPHTIAKIEIQGSQVAGPTFWKMLMQSRMSETMSYSDRMHMELYERICVKLGCISGGRYSYMMYVTIMADIAFPIR